jgi:hypothetical protein
MIRGGGESALGILQARAASIRSRKRLAADIALSPYIRLLRWDFQIKLHYFMCSFSATN